jgi:signal transduction histidine kinase
VIEYWATARCRAFPVPRGRPRRHDDGMGRPRRREQRPLWKYLALLLTAALILVFIVLLLYTREEYFWAPPTEGWIIVTICGGFAAAAAVLVWEPGQRVNGALLAAFGVCFWISNWYPLFTPPAWAVPTAMAIDASQFVPYLLLTTVLLRYPERRLAYRYERVCLAVSGVWLVGWQLVASSSAPPNSAPIHSWPTWLLNYDRQVDAQNALIIGMIAILAVLTLHMMLRIVRTRSLDRRTYGPVFAATVAAAVVVVINLLAADRDLPSTRVQVQHFETVRLATLLSIPIALLLGMVLIRLDRSRVADLVVRLKSAGEPSELEEALRQTMADPSLTLLFKSDDLNSYHDVNGAPSPPPEAWPGRLQVAVSNPRGEPLAVVLAHPSVDHHRALFDAALTASAFALENAALQASLLARIVELRESRARLTETSVAERKRMERDLHDGAQQRLLALGLTLSRAESNSHDGPAAVLLQQARAELAEALHVLRDLARGLYPAVLTQLGLGPALEVVAERLPLQVSLAVPARRWSQAVETTAYFIICEALTNAAKHAAADQARVVVQEREQRLVLEVTDDGRGDARLQWGTGLVGLRDRAAAAGGTFSIVSNSSSGTTICAELPCE